MATPEQITEHHEWDARDAGTIWVDAPPAPETIAIADYDPTWPQVYEGLAERIREALGPTVLALDHVGSTAVPGLAAKAVIDIDLTVADSSDEASFVVDLEHAGFRLTIREPNWHEHRAFKGDDPRVNVHVFSPGCPETIRHLMFRD